MELCSLPSGLWLQISKSKKTPVMLCLGPLSQIRVDTLCFFYSFGLLKIGTLSIYGWVRLCSNQHDHQHGSSSWSLPPQSISKDRYNCFMSCLGFCAKLIDEVVMASASRFGNFTRTTYVCVGVCFSRAQVLVKLWHVVSSPELLSDIQSPKCAGN
jgi:hypothetical protein